MFYLFSLGVCKFVQIVVLIWTIEGGGDFVFVFFFLVNIYFVGFEFFIFFLLLLLFGIVMFLVFNEACLLLVSLCN